MQLLEERPDIVDRKARYKDVARELEADERWASLQTPKSLKAVAGEFETGEICKFVAQRQPYTPSRKRGALAVKLFTLELLHTVGTQLNSTPRVVQV